MKIITFIFPPFKASNKITQTSSSILMTSEKKHFILYTIIVNENKQIGS